MSMYKYRNQLGPQRATVIYWPIVLFALVFEALGEEIKLLLVVFGLLVMTVRFRADIDLRMPRYVPLLIFIIVFGLLSSVLNGQLDQFGIYKFVRDVAYYASPFLLWIFGCNIGKVIAEEDGFWTTLFAMSAAAAVGTIVVGIANNGIALTMSSFKANELMIYAVVLFAVPPENWRWRKEHRNAVLFWTVFDAIALVITLSRTTIICLAVVLVVLAMKSFSHFFRVTIIGIICIAFVAGSVSLMPVNVTSSFMDKVANSLDEVSSSGNVWTESTINQNWRGYEKYCAIRNFNHADSFTKLFGNGFGYQLDMGGYSSLVVKGSSGGIPFLHNGYFSVLFKCGMLGLFCLIMFFALQMVSAFKNWFSNGEYIDGLVAGILVCLAFCSYVIEGIFIPSGMYYFTLPLAMIYGLSLAKARC